MENIPWLNPVINDFCTQLKSQQVGHAYLVGVGVGYGGELLALALAKAAMCQTLTLTGSCGLCKACLLVEANSHPDLYHLMADGNQIKVDQIRELCQKLTSTSQQGGWRVAVITHSEKLNTAAANALLKTLEEPGKNTLLLLQSDTPSRLMATISSRCQRLHFQAPSHDEIKTWLAQDIELTSDVTWCLPAMGGPLELSSALKNHRYEQLLQLRKDWVQSLSSGHLCANLMDINEKQFSDAIQVFYLILKQKLVKQTQLDALLRVKISDLAAKVMRIHHKLSVMPNVSYLALFQGFILEYKKLT